ncbi:suppressor of fused domain protein [Volucribacter amazonae]|uniref:Riboflavin biosynthesis protein n=1 Tax=Volucribacter amazonae TaxID=256731 RepID=A0A9X4P9Q6_9PAST|nr:suppressor of fused domain protein [Volucribacter amazonae]MDG6894322.1 riboflavin biosynthesis protein [Volucribacter amazonae]
MNKDEYIAKFSENDAVGWEAIDEILDEIYKGKEPRHYATTLKYMLGGEDPLDGVSIYDTNQQQFHRHIISYGMSELYYNPESVENEFSGWGFEFNMRVTPFSEDENSGDAKNEPIWVINLMQNLARYVFDSKNFFQAYHFIPTDGPIRFDTDTKLSAIIFVPDPIIDRINTPNGMVEMLCMFGITDDEYNWLLLEPTAQRVKELADIIAKDNPMFITDLTRKFSYV